MTRRLRTVALIAGLFAANEVVFAQQGAARDGGSQRSVPAGSASIIGIVVLDGTSSAQPIRRAIVTLTGTGIATSRQLLTDDQGRFAFAGLSAGRFNLTAEKPAYVKAYYGSTRPGRPPGTPITVAEAQQVTGISIPLLKGASISGRMLEESGVPVVGGQVSVELTSFVNGQRRSTRPYAGSYQVVTDDRGVYRTYGLPPGEYIVRAVGGGSGLGSLRLVTSADIDAATREMSGGARPAPVTTPAATPQLSRVTSFHPGVSDVSGAQTVIVRAGEDRGGVDIVSRVVRVARASGLALSPSGQPVQNMSVGLANLSVGSLYTSLGGVRADASGRFVVGGLTPGRWLLFGRAAEPNTPSDQQFPWWGSTEFVIGEQDVADLVLTFSEGSTVTGRVLFTGAGKPPDPSRLRVTLVSLPAVPETGPPSIAATPAADGSFAMKSVPAGKYRVTMAPAAGWVLQTGTTGALDVLDNPLEIARGQDASITLTLTDRVTEISGTLRDAAGRPAPEYSVLVFSADRAHWGTAPRRTSGLVKLATDGSYRITGLPPGEYMLCVVTDLDQSQLGDPTLFDQLLQGGVKITLVEGEKKTQDFKIGGQAVRDGAPGLQTRGWL